MLTLEDPFDDPPSSILGNLLQSLSQVFALVFALESLVRMVAMGLWGHTKHTAFFNDSWNILDLVIVVGGLLELGGSSSVKFSMLRTLRVLRPLRSITRIPSLRLLITVIIQAWRPLMCAAVVTLVLTCSLAIVGVAAFQGKLRNRCFSLHTGHLSESFRRCDLGGNGRSSLLQGVYTCPYFEQCLPLGLPRAGDAVGDFDNVFHASLSVFRIMLLDDWTTLMFDTADASSLSSLIYFLIVVLGGPCFATNLFLAVITQRLTRLSAVETIAILKVCVCRWQHKAESRAFGKWKSHWAGSQEALESTIRSKLDGTQMMVYQALLVRMGFQYGILRGAQHSRAWNSWKHHAQQAKYTRLARLRNALPNDLDNNLSGEGEGGLCKGCIMQMSLVRYHVKTWATNLVVSTGLEHAVVQAVVWSTIVQAMEHDGESLPGRGWKTGADFLFFHGVLDLVGLVFTYLFVTEFALKSAMLGIKNYVLDANNAIDIAVVLTGMIETPAVLTAINCKLYAPTDALRDHCILTGGNGIALLRCARLLKLGKLLGKFPAVAFQLQSILRSMTDAYTVLLLLAISTFVFAILGVNLFGGEIRITSLNSPNAQELIRAGSRVFVSGQPTYATTAAGGGVKDHSQITQILAGKIDRISTLLHPTRPLRIQPLNGFTFSSRPSDMLPFWEALPSETVTPMAAASHQGSGQANGILSAEEMSLFAVIPRFNTDTFWDGLLVAFQLSIGVDVGESLALAVATGSSTIAYIYFLMVILLGNWVLFNCFIATMIVSFRREAILSNESKSRIFSAVTAKEIAKSQHSMLLNKERFENRIQRMTENARSAQEVMATIQSLSIIKKKDRMKSGEMLAQTLMSKQLVYEQELVAIKREEHAALGAKNEQLADRCRILKKHLGDTLRQLDKGILILNAPDTLFGLLDPLDPSRVKTLAMIESDTFQHVINLLLLSSIVCLALERRDMGIQERNTLDIINLLLNMVFACEFMIKAFALSFKTYLKDPLNRLDFLIVIFGVVDMALVLGSRPLIKPALVPTSDTAIFGVLRIMRIVKTLRPLRQLLFRIQRVRIVANAIKESIGPLQLAAAIALVLVLILGVFGQQLFAGRMSGCSDPLVHLRTDCSGSMPDGQERTWRAPELNCDWILDAVILMFTAISKDKWRLILWSISDISGRGSGPFVDASWYHAILLLVALILGSVFTLNLLVALFVESYTKEMIQVRQHINDTPKCLQIKGRESLPRLWDRPRANWRALVLNVLESKGMTRFLTAIFFINFFVASCESYKGAAWTQELNCIGNALLAFMFGAEACVKLIVLGPARYFDVHENSRDFVSALLTLAGEALHASIMEGQQGYVGQYFQDEIFLLLERLLSIARLSGWLRVLRLDPDLGAMINILLLAAGIIVQVVGVLIIALFVFGVVAVQLFGNICTPHDSTSAATAIYQRSLSNALLVAERGSVSDALLLQPLGEGGGDGGQVNYFVNSDGLRCLLGTKEKQLPNSLYFNHLGSALLTLFITAMGDGWSKVMVACSIAVTSYPRKEGYMERGVEHLKSYLVDPLSKAGLAALEKARFEFPGCITSDELKLLGEQKLLQCDKEGGKFCEGTCGSQISKVFFVVFFLVTNVMILNIIVATLLEQVGASELPLQGALTMGLSMRKFHRIFHMWKRHGVLRTRLSMSPDPTLSLRAKEKRFVGRRRRIQAQMDLEKLMVVKTKTARKEELQRRHANLHEDQVASGHLVKGLTLLDEVLGPADYESRAQHLDDIRMATELDKHLRRHRQGERRALELWRKTVPDLMHEALELDHWTGLPSHAFCNKTRKLSKHIKACHRLGALRSQIWAAASADAEMQQAIMRDVTQFLTFVAHELDTTKLLLHELNDELDDMALDARLDIKISCQVENKGVEQRETANHQRTLVRELGQTPSAASEVYTSTRHYGGMARWSKEGERTDQSELSELSELRLQLQTNRSVSFFVSAYDFSCGHVHMSRSLVLSWCLLSVPASQVYLPLALFPCLSLCPPFSPCLPLCPPLSQTQTHTRRIEAGRKALQTHGQALVIYLENRLQLHLTHAHLSTLQVACVK